ncbi:MAG: rRNA pseudouridine synthase [Oscillospiraceae bacterium]|jgi:23S rRNA pseudouridine2605 synthase|nr:rRNA pseudouridine synthase [Oscillospiraceae bacterium]
MTDRLQKIISAYGVASRRAAEELIKQGRVTVNGSAAVLGQSADIERDIIAVNGRVLAAPPKLVYIMLYKPRGYVTTMKDERGRKSVDMLVRECPERVYPVGRLDLNSEGLLLMTNDGALANGLAHPGREVEKVYRVSAAGNDISLVERLTKITELDGEKISPASAYVTNSGEGRMTFEITIHEGKNRQIRRMCEEVGLEIKRLKRIREGTLELAGLKPGEWRYLEKNEIRYLKSLTLKSKSEEF